MSTADLGPDVNIGRSAVAAGWCEASVAIVIVSLRMFTQAKIIRRVDLDDYLMVLALVIAMLNTSLITHAVSWGIGRHIYYLTDEQRINAIKYEFIAQTPGIVAPTLARISFAIYLTKFIGFSKTRKWILWSVVISQAVVNIIQIILILAQCEHFSALWDPSIGGKCWSPKVQVYSGYFLGALNCVHDIILTILPITILKDLNMSVRIKVILSILMGMSIFAFIASIIKTIMLGNLGKRSDFTYYTVSFIIWFTTENYVVIVASSIPSLRPLLVHVKKEISSAGNSHPMDGYGNASRRATKGYMPYGDGNDGTLVSSKRSVAVGKGGETSVTGTKLPDSESEEYILPTQNENKKGILKTTNVSVVYTESERRDLERGV